MDVGGRAKQEPEPKREPGKTNTASDGLTTSNALIVVMSCIVLFPLYSIPASSNEYDLATPGPTTYGAFLYLVWIHKQL